MTGPRAIFAAALERHAAGQWPTDRDASLERARVALDRAADELVTVLALDGLPDTIRRGAAVALRDVAGTHALAEAIGEGAVEEPACDRTGTHPEPASARGPGDVTGEPRRPA